MSSSKRNLEGDYVALAPDTDTPLYGADPIFASAVVIREEDGSLFALVSTAMLALPSDGPEYEDAEQEAQSLREDITAVTNPMHGISFDFWIPLPDTATRQDAIDAIATSGTIEFARKYHNG